MRYRIKARLDDDANVHDFFVGDIAGTFQNPVAADADLADLADLVNRSGLVGLFHPDGRPRKIR